MERLIPPLKAILISMLWSKPSFAQAYEDRDVWWHSGWGWDHMVFGGLMMIAFWGGIILLIVLLVRWLGTGLVQPRLDTTSANTPRDSAAALRQGGDRSERIRAGQEAAVRLTPSVFP